MSDEYQSSGSGASKTFPKQCSALRKSDFVMIKGKPCKIMDMSTSKTGKHGHAKVHLVGLDIFDQKKYEDICPSTHNMDVPHVNRIEYTVLDIDDEGYMTLMDEKTDCRSDIKAAGKILEEVKDGLALGDSDVFVTILNALDQEQAIACKTKTSK